MTLDRLLTHPDLVHLARALRETPGKAVSDDEPTSWAAIALILRMGALREPELLMIKRAEAEQDPWSGHVACPGGRREPGDHAGLPGARLICPETQRGAAGGCASFVSGSAAWSALVSFMSPATGGATPAYGVRASPCPSGRVRAGAPAWRLALAPALRAPVTSGDGCLRPRLSQIRDDATMR